METRDNLEQALAIADAVDYQEGSVVSRTLYRREAGNVTVFAFDREQGLSPHTVPHDAVVLLLEGEAEITVGGVAHRLGAGNAILMPGGVSHSVRAVERFKMLLTMWT
jgi:quercetin dioxygenase-like cupin family protein